MEKQIPIFVFDNNSQFPDSLSELPTIGGVVKDPWNNPWRCHPREILQFSYCLIAKHAFDFFTDVLEPFFFTDRIS